MTAAASNADRTPRAAPLVVGAAAAAAVAAVAARSPFQTGHWLGCPLHTLTGLYCPLCGATRATWAAVHGHFALMATECAIVPVLAVAAVWVWLRWLTISLGAPWTVPAIPWGRTRARRWALGIAVLAFTVARNLPWLHPLAPHGHP